MRKILSEDWPWFLFCGAIVLVVGVLFVYAGSLPRDRALQMKKGPPPSSAFIAVR